MPHCFGQVTHSNPVSLRKSVGLFQEFIRYSLQKICTQDEKKFTKSREVGGGWLEGKRGAAESFKRENELPFAVSGLS